MILVNYKNYQETWGDKAVEIAKICEKVAKETKVPIYPVVSALDGHRIMKETGIKTILQAVGERWEGASSGQVSALAAEKIGISGSLLNHSEMKMKPGTIKKLLAVWPGNFWSIVCIHSIGQAEGWAKNIRPSYVAYEPTYLIGNKDKSVASEKAQDIKKIVEHYQKQKVPVLVGAGIHQGEDVKMSLRMGAKGILVASDIIKAANPEKELHELAQAFNV